MIENLRETLETLDAFVDTGTLRAFCARRTLENAVLDALIRVLRAVYPDTPERHAAVAAVHEIRHSETATEQQRAACLIAARLCLEGHRGSPAL